MVCALMKNEKRGRGVIETRFIMLWWPQKEWKKQIHEQECDGMQGNENSSPPNPPIPAAELIRHVSHNTKASKRKQNSQTKMKRRNIDEKKEELKNYSFLLILLLPSPEIQFQFQPEFRFGFHQGKVVRWIVDFVSICGFHIHWCSIGEKIEICLGTNDCFSSDIAYDLIWRRMKEEREVWVE